MDTRQCISCKKDKPLTREFFYELKYNAKVTFRRQCKCCIKEQKRTYNGGHSHERSVLTMAWLKEHPEQRRVIVNRREQKYRVDALNAYGHHCECCGESRTHFLTIDHIGGRKVVGHDRSLRGRKLYHWLKRNNYPKGFRVLCWNCNCSIGMYGECPHQEEKRLLQGVSTNKSGEVIGNIC